jgi:hypothetical protein
LSVLLAVAVFCGVLTSGWLTTAAIIDIDIEAEMELEIPMETMSTGFLPNGVYYFRNVYSDLVMHVPNGEGNGTRVRQWGRFDALHLQWRVEHLTSGVYRITTAYAPHWHLSFSGNNVIVSATQTLWRITANSNGGFNVTPENDSTRRLANTSKNNDNPATFLEVNAAPNTADVVRWHIERVCVISGHKWGPWDEFLPVTCESPRIDRRVCERFGCIGDDFRQNGDPLRHADNAFGVCTQIRTIFMLDIVIYTCGRIENPVSGGFTHYMFRGGGAGSNAATARRINHRFPVYGPGALEGRRHDGIDIISISGAPSINGTPTYSVGNGTVHHRGGLGAYGQCVIIQTSAHRIYYAHFQNNSIPNHLQPPVGSTPGTSVTSSSHLGNVGNTPGIMTLSNGQVINVGIHLHFEVQNLNGTPLNPEDFFPGGNFFVRATY